MSRAAWCGAIDQAAPNEPGYTGKFAEPDLGIQNFGARWYDPRIGRFLSIDPAGFDPQNPQSFNRYAYANNNPYRYVDPDGRAAETALDVISLSLSLSLNAFRNDPSLANGLGLAYDAAATAVPFLPAGFGIIKHAANAAGDAGRAADSTVIGKLNDIKAAKLQPGEKTLLDLLPDQGNAKANWKQNSSVLRQEIQKGQPIRDASVDSAGNREITPDSCGLNVTC
ncbi:MAG: RHS repeat-associated core domain-containing protein [Gammaproteobacteria bacterium]